MPRTPSPDPDVDAARLAAADETTLLHLGGPPAAWGNLGLWPADGYAAAARALADAVAAAGGLDAGHRVLSYGSGAGEELGHWVDARGAESALGVDPMVAAHSPAPAIGDSRITVLRASALAPLPADLVPHGGFDTVLCVDAAYHFSPRATWLQRAFELLAPGGGIAFCDLGGTPPRSAALRAMLGFAARATGVDARELCSADEAVRRVADAGFIDVEVRALDEAVLGGFERFVDEHSRRFAIDAQHPGWRRVTGTAWLIRQARPRGLGYLLLSGRKPQRGDSRRRSAASSASTEIGLVQCSRKPAASA
jgi:SAM-dependent methyltransferase